MLQQDKTRRHVVIMVGPVLLKRRPHTICIAGMQDPQAGPDSQDQDQERQAESEQTVESRDARESEMSSEDEDWVRLSPHDEGRSRHDQPRPLAGPVPDRRFSRRGGPQEQMPPRDMQQGPPRDMPRQQPLREEPREESREESREVPRRPSGPQVRAIHEEPMPMEGPVEREQKPLWQVRLSQCGKICN